MKKTRHYRGGYQSAGLTDFARDLRKSATPAEETLWRLLRKRQLRGFKFRRQHQIGNYIADFYCDEAKLVIECDGMIHDANAQWQHDQSRDAYMISQAIRVVRFTNEEILTDSERVCDEILRYLQPVQK